MRAPTFWDYASGPKSAPLLRAILTPLSWMVGALGRYRILNTKAQRAGVPVICIGNITLGGTGKTPLALALAKLLRQNGQRPVFLTRGYGGGAAGPLLVNIQRHDAVLTGDEALQLAAVAPTVLARNRPGGAALAVRAGASVILMDDGFQNPSLHKDFSLLVLDGIAGLGNGRVFPAGPLREPLNDALARADVLVIMGDGSLPFETSLPVLQARLVNPVAPPDGPLLAFAGIGRPQKFFDALHAAGADLVQVAPFADHHRYRSQELASLRRQAKAIQARLITTTKDFVRLPEGHQDGIICWPVQAHIQDPGALMTRLEPLINQQAHP